MFTESLPVDCARVDNRLVSAQENASAPTIASSTSRKIRTGTAALGAAEFPSNSRSYRWVRRRNDRSCVVSTRKPRGYRFDTRFSAGKRGAFSALRSTGIPVIWSWNSPPRNPDWRVRAGAHFSVERCDAAVDAVGCGYSSEQSQGKQKSLAETIAWYR